MYITFVCWLQIAFNPNRHECCWVATGGDQGFVRLTNIQNLLPPPIYIPLKKDGDFWWSQHFGNRLTNITLLLYKNTDQTLLTNKSHGPNALQSRWYMCIQWTRVLYSVVITRQSNPPISKFNSLCNKLTSFWSMFVYNNGQFW